MKDYRLPAAAASAEQLSRRTLDVFFFEHIATELAERLKLQPDWQNQRIGYIGFAGAHFQRLLSEANNELQLTAFSLTDCITDSETLAAVEPEQFDVWILDFALEAYQIEFLTEFVHASLAPGGRVYSAAFAQNNLEAVSKAVYELGYAPVTNPTLTIHFLGNTLHGGGFEETVLDAVDYALEYSQAHKLQADAKALPLPNWNQDRSKGLMTKARLKKILEACLAVKIAPVVMYATAVKKAAALPGGSVHVNFDSA